MHYKSIQIDEICRCFHIQSNEMFLHGVKMLIMQLVYDFSKSNKVVTSFIVNTELHLAALFWKGMLKDTRGHIHRGNSFHKVQVSD